jgi:hypothetical protein
MDDKVLKSLGTQPGPEMERDAVHFAVAPVTAVEDLSPGDHVGKDPYRNGFCSILSGAKGVGIVDPFLQQRVKAGERFWLFLYPGTITSLRHQWSHPAFGEHEALPSGKSEQWLRAFALMYRADYDQMVTGAASGEGAFFGTTGGPEEARGPEFWYHLSVVTGRVFSEEHRENTPFRCGC